MLETTQTSDRRSETFLNEHALAERWAISVKTLRNRRVTGGFLPFVKLSRSVRYRLSDVIAWEEANTRENTCQLTRGPQPDRVISPKARLVRESTPTVKVFQIKDLSGERREP